MLVSRASLLILVALTLAACDLSGADAVSDAAPANEAVVAEPLFGQSSSAPFLESYVGFAVIGHSNAVGKGDSLISQDSTIIPANVAFQFRRNPAGFIPLRDPVGTANTGSAWPSFAREFYDQTCRGTFIVPIAQRGSFLALESNWRGTDNYWSRSEDPDDHYHRLLMGVSYQAFTAASAQGGSRVSWGGVLMWLGNGDAEKLTEQPIYEDSVYTVFARSLTNFLDAYAEDFGVGKVYIITDIREIVGNHLVDHPEFQEIRQAQRDVCATHPFCVLASDEGYTYPIEQYEDRKHLNQYGLLGIGRSSAASAAAEIGALPGCNG